MSGIVIDHSACINCGICISGCPFNALSDESGQVEVNAGCRVCKICIGLCPVKAISLQESIKKLINKDDYQGILVYVEHTDGKIHPVTYELIGKALELAKVIKQDVNCLFIGHDVHKAANELLAYGVKKVLVYQDQALRYFRVDNFANMFEDAIKRLMPNTVLVGATTTGRSLAPRVAVRFKTGLTADTTVLQMRPNTDLVQIRPAYGGNIMAQILTTKNRPQFATVRYKVMDSAKKVDHIDGEVILVDFDRSLLDSKIDILDIKRKEATFEISEAEVVVVAGSGVKDDKGMMLIEELAQLLNGVVGVTRPMVEKGKANYLHQIGLSGRTVKPKLIITCGVSGAIQFVAGMDSSETIMAINSDPEAPIFKCAHYGIVGDLYEILPRLINQIKGGNESAV